jgi:hypothetical protein
MDALVMIAAFWVSCLPVWAVDFGACSDQTSESAEAVRRLAAEFESAQRSAFDIALNAKTEAERKAADRAMADRRRYAQRFLELVSATTDEAAAVDALVWVVRYGFRTPESDEAVQKIAEENCAFLSENLGLGAGQILKCIAETHPQSATRWEAECGLARQQMEIASLVADLRAVASLPPESKQCAVPGLAAACVFGGETRLFAVDSKALVNEIEHRLKRIANRVNDVNNPGIIYFHLTMDTPILSQYHAATEALLRRAAGGHPDLRFRAGARRSLATYLAGIADVSRTIDSNRAYWVDRVGEDRVMQIRNLGRDRLLNESSALADELSNENQAAGRIPDKKVEALRKANVRPGGDPPRPQRVSPP